MNVAQLHVPRISWRTIDRSVFQFRLAPASPQRLAWFRIGLACVLLVQALSLMGHLDDFYGRYGVTEWSAMIQDPPPAVPDLSWLDHAAVRLGLPTAFVVPTAYGIYVVGLVGVLCGCGTRLAAAIAWLSHTALITSSYMSSYGVDQFAHIGLFYCVWFPVGRSQPFVRSEQRAKLYSTFEAWLGLRVLQAHMCIAYTASGIEKAMGEQWWNGEAVWRAIMTTPLEGPIDCSFLASVPWLGQTLCWMTLVLEAGTLGFIWHPWLRKVWLIGIVGMHLSIALLMNLWTFSAAMIVFDIAAFGLPVLGGRRVERRELRA